MTSHTTTPAAAVSILRDALTKIEHSMRQAKNPGNDRLRELDLSHNIALTALAATERAAIQPAAELVGVVPEMPSFDTPVCAPVQAAPDAVQYVPMAVHQSDFAGGCHPNDKTPNDPACRAELDERGDDRGQGLDPYWKWGFRAGYEACKTAPAVQAAPVAETYTHTMNFGRGRPDDPPSTTLVCVRMLRDDVPAGMNLYLAATEVKQASELPPLPETRYNGYGDGSQPLYTEEMMHAYVLADRAARSPVAAPQPDQLKFTGFIPKRAEDHQPKVAAPQPDVSARDAALGVAGTMGNVLYNLAQRQGYVLTDADCEMYSGLRQKWDAAIHKVRTGAAPESAEPSAEQRAEALRQERIGEAVAYWKCCWPWQLENVMFHNGARIVKAEFQARARLATSSAAKGVA